MTRAALKAAAHGDIPTAFDVFLRGVGGDGYRQALRRQIGEDGLAAAAGKSAYFFAREMPALAAWSFGPAEADAVTAPALVVTGAGTSPWFHENATILAAMLPHAETLTLPGLNHPAPLTDPANLGPGDRRLRPPGTGKIWTKPAAEPEPANQVNGRLPRRGASRQQGSPPGRPSHPGHQSPGGSSGRKLLARTRTTW